ncbi:MAG: hypothetical protein WBL92_05990 [Methanothrix sp.]|jgi:hypothetical protein
MDLFEATYILPQTVISEGQALTHYIVAPDIQIALKLADENRMDLDLVKLELIERDVIIAANEQQA